MQGTVLVDHRIINSFPSLLARKEKTFSTCIQRKGQKSIWKMASRKTSWETPWACDILTGVSRGSSQRRQRIWRGTLKLLLGGFSTSLKTKLRGETIMATIQKFEESENVSLDSFWYRYYFLITWIAPFCSAFPMISKPAPTWTRPKVWKGC